MAEKTDLGKLSFNELLLLMNSCDFGEVTKITRLKTICQEQGFKVINKDGKTVNILKFLGLLIQKRHHAEPVFKLQNIIEPHKTKHQLPDLRKVEAKVSWREVMANKEVFDDNAKEIFLRNYSMTREKKRSATLAGVHCVTVDRAVKEDQQFKFAMAEAEEYYRDLVHEIGMDHMNGVPRAVFGGKGKEKLMGYETVYPNSKILEMELKRTNPEYTEKHEIDLSVVGGVLMAPADMTMEAYIKANVKTISKDDGVIDV